MELLLDQVITIKLAVFLLAILIHYYVTTKSSFITLEDYSFVDYCGTAVPTCPIGGSRVPVVEGAAQHGVLSGLQHDVAAHEPPDAAAAVSQQAAQRGRPRGVVRHPENQHAQIQQVAVGRVPPPGPEGQVSVALVYSGSRSLRQLH